MGFNSDRAVKSIRKPRRCCACGTMLNAGDAAINSTGVADGDFYSNDYHTDCRAAEIALNEMHGADEWLGLWGFDWEDARWLIAEYPAVAERKGITLAKVEEQEQDRERSRLAWAEIERKRAALRTPVSDGKSGQ
jgi:hypothetical protein